MKKVGKKDGRTKTETLARAKDRIARLGGQVKALWNMAEKGEDWKKLLTFAAAIQGASDEVTAELFQGYLESMTDGKAFAKEAREGLALVLKRL